MYENIHGTLRGKYVGMYRPGHLGWEMGINASEVVNVKPAPG